MGRDVLRTRVAGGPGVSDPGVSDPEVSDPGGRVDRRRGAVAADQVQAPARGADGAAGIPAVEGKAVAVVAAAVAERRRSCHDQVSEGARSRSRLASAATPIASTPFAAGYRSVPG